MPYIGQGLQQGRRQLNTFTATASQTTFSASYTQGYVDVYQNGILLAPSDYTATNGTTVVLAVGAAVNDEITIISQHLFSLADVVSASTGGTFTGDVTVTGNLTVQGTTITVDTSTAQTLAMGDADKISLGDNGDFTIHHDGNNNIIRATNGHNTWIQTDGNLALTKKNAAEYYAIFYADAQVQLRHNNITKFETTTAGINVGISAQTTDTDIKLINDNKTFGIRADRAGSYFSVVDFDAGANRLVIDTSGNLLVAKNISDGATTGFEARATGQVMATIASASNEAVMYITQSGGGGNNNVDQGLVVKTEGTNAVSGTGNVLRIAANNATHGTFDNILVAKNNGNVGIGTDNPGARKMRIVGSSSAYPLSLDSTNTDYQLEFQKNGTSEWWIVASASSFKIHENGVGDKLTILSGGNVGIGTNAPDQTLTLNSSIGTNSSTAFTSMDGRIGFDTDYSDTQRGPNKIVLQNDGSWVSGLGISSNSTDIYTGGEISFQKSVDPQGAGTYNEMAVMSTGGMDFTPSGSGSFNFWGNGGNQLSIKTSQYTGGSGTSIGTSNIQVVNSAFGALVFVAGYGNGQFCDLVYFGYNASPTIIAQQTIAGSPPSRIYTGSGYALYLRYSSGSLTTKVNCIQSHS